MLHASTCRDNPVMVMSSQETGSDPPPPPHLEVVPKGPAPQHLEEGVVGQVPAHVLQVVVFAAGSDAFLTVDHATVRRHAAARIRGAEEDRLELEPDTEPTSGSSEHDRAEQNL